MPALVAATGLPPAEIISQLAALAGAREVSFDLGKAQALAWKVGGAPGGGVVLCVGEGGGGGAPAGACG